MDTLTPAQQIDFSVALHIVCEATNVVAEDVLYRRPGPQHVSRARMLAAYVLRHALDWTMEDIATALCRDRVTILHALKKVEALCAENAAYGLWVSCMIEKAKGV